MAYQIETIILLASTQAELEDTNKRCAEWEDRLL